MADFDDIIQEINTNIPDNNTQAITAKKLRDTLVDLTDAIETQQSEFEDGIQTQQSDFETNITNRQEAFENDVDEQLSSINTQFATGQNIGDVGIDNEPTAGSENLVKSGGVNDALSECIIDASKNTVRDLSSLTTRGFVIKADGNWNSDISYKHVRTTVNAGEKFYIKAAADKQTTYAFLTSTDVDPGNPAPLVNGTTIERIKEGCTKIITIPDTCQYLYFVTARKESDQIVYGYLPESMIKLSSFKDEYDNFLQKKEQELTDAEKQQVMKNTGIDTELDITRDALQWQHCGMLGKMSIWMSGGEFTSKGSTYFVTYRQVSKNDLFKCTVTNNAIIGFSTAIPAVGGAYTPLASASSAKEFILKMPADGYICAAMRVGSTYDVKLRTLNKYNLNSYMCHVLEDIGLSANKAIVVNPDSASYGTIVTPGSPSYFLSDFVDISSFNYISIPIIYTTAGTAGDNPDKNYGAVFYDENKEFVSVVDNTIHKAVSTADSGFSVYKVPSGVKYVRISTYGSNYKKIIGFNTVEASVNPEQDITVLVLNPDSEMLPKMVIAKKKKYTSNSGDNTIIPLVLAHISDEHGVATQYQRFLEFANHWKDKGYVDEIIDTGDVVTDTYSNGVTWRDSISGVKNIITVIGNHDTRASSTEMESQDYPQGQNQWQYHSNISLDATKRNDMYNRFMIGPDDNNPYISNWGVTQPSDAAANGLCYYYKDYASRNLRMIAVDVMGYDQTQDEWLQARLTESITLGYHVFIIAHFCGEVMTGLSCNYTSLFNTGTYRSAIDMFNSYIHNMPVSVDAFQSAGGNFAGYLIGHYHRDMVNILTDYPKQLAFAVSSGGKTPIRDFTKVEGCKSYDDFQIVSINTYDKTVRLIKVGADTDYYMRKKGTICVGYTLVKDDGTEPEQGETPTKVKGVIGEGW